MSVCPASYDMKVESGQPSCFYGPRWPLLASSQYLESPAEYSPRGSVATSMVLCQTVEAEQ